MANQLPDPEGLQPASLMFGQVAAPQPLARHEADLPSPVATYGPVPEEEGPMPHPNHPPRTEGKPFGFALAHGIDGAQVWYGQLCATVTRSSFEQKYIGSREVHKFIQGDEITNVGTHVPANLNTDHRKTTHLGWWGNVYLYWEVAVSGGVTLCDVRGPDEPTGHNIAKINSDMVRADEEDGKYFVLIGTVNQGSPVVQNISGDVHWAAHIISGESGDKEGVFDLDFEIYETVVNFYDETVDEVLTYVEYWRDGMYVGGFDVSEGGATSAPYDDENYPALKGSLRTRKVSHVTGNNSPPS